ncbi:MAG: hypothetical protein C9356_11850 [Oleiphilus sp.]|nr:MAG: hypothetical protein C9356_11850 [Oleiphilus sp.]
MKLTKNAERSYRKFLKKTGRTVRSGQLEMVRFIDRYLDSGSRDGCIVEAGTGTGKTIGYSVPAIAHSLAQNKRTIISTATIALQAQLVDQDLPEIQSASGLKFSFGLLKGRGNFVCPKKLSKHLASEPHIELMQALGKSWDGDREQVPSTLSNAQWQELTCEPAECTAKRCPYYQSCPYYTHRENALKKDVLVTNHALLMSDLSMGGGLLLPELSESVLVMDEYHKVPDIARDHFARALPVAKRMRSLRSFIKALKGMKENAVVDGWVDDLVAALVVVGKGLKSERACIDHLREDVVFVDGAAPELLRTNADSRLREALSAYRVLEVMGKWLEHNQESHGGLATDVFDHLESLYKRLADDLNNDSMVWSVLKRVDQGVPYARWISAGAGEPTFHVAPTCAAKALASHLWSGSYKVVGCSATLRVNGSFDRLFEATGNTGEAFVAHSPFDYARQCNLVVGPLKHRPQDQGFYTEARAFIAQRCAEYKASLVLFTSIKKMQECYAELPTALRDKVKMQGQMSKAQMLTQHKRDIDAGNTSILFGVDSLSEGVDLVGRYLECLIVVKVQFECPSDPIGLTQQRHYQKTGRNAFADIQVPKAAIKMVQSCGRLIRSESDTGAIYILDRRLNEKPYGKTILGSLPMKVDALDSQRIVTSAVQ